MRDREDEKGTCRAGKEEGKGAKQDTQEERKDEALGQSQRGAGCLSPTALLLHSLGSHTWGVPVLPAPLLALAHQLTVGNGKAGKKPQERGREAIVISLL